MELLVIAVSTFVFLSLVWLLGNYSYRKRKFEEEKKYELLYKESLEVNTDKDLVDINDVDLDSYKEDEDDAEARRIEKYLELRKKDKK